MLGSIPKEFSLRSDVNDVRLYAVRVPGGTLWGWERRTGDGEVIAHAVQLFPDYVTCLCDAQRRT